MTTPKQLSEAEITSNDRGFCNDLRVFDNKDNLLKNWTGKAILGFCMYDDNDGYQEWNVTTTPYRDKANGYRVRECYIAHSEAEQPVKQVKSAEEILNPYVQTPDEAPDYVFLFQALQAMHEYASQFQTPALGISEGSQWVSMDSDILPPFDEKLEIILENGERHLGYFNGADTKGEHFFCDNNDYHYPTHWKLLSPPPGQSSQPQPNAISVIEEEIAGYKSEQEYYKDDAVYFGLLNIKIDTLQELLRKTKS